MGESWTRDLSFYKLLESGKRDSYLRIIYDCIKEIQPCCVKDIILYLNKNTNGINWEGNSKVPPRVSELKNDFKVIKKVGNKLLNGHWYETYIIGTNDEKECLSETEMKNILKKIGKANGFQKKIMMEALK